MKVRYGIALSVCLVAGFGQSVLAAPTSDVVYGNLGVSGTDPLGDFGSDLGPSAATSKILAQGFTTGSSADYLKVQGVTMGAFAETLSPRTVSIYTNAVGDVPGTLVATSSAVDVQAKNSYVFGFDNVALSPSTSYWVVPQFDADWFWYLDEDIVAPVEQNGSGYSYLGTKRSNNNLAGTWSNTSQGLSLSINAVPEPSTIALAVVGVAGLVGFRLRRRLSRVG